MGTEMKMQEAIAFITHPDLVNMPSTAKREFLRQKGLSDDDITIAFSEAAIKSQDSPASWSLTSKVSSLVLLGGLAYIGYTGAMITWNWLRGGQSSEEVKDSTVQSSLASIEEKLVQLETRLSAMEAASALESSARLQSMSKTEMEQRELRSQLESVRGLVLSKASFPAAPKPLMTGPLKLPAWQLSTPVQATTPNLTTTLSESSVALTNGSSLASCDVNQGNLATNDNASSDEDHTCSSHGSISNEKERETESTDFEASTTSVGAEDKTVQ